MRVCVCVCVCVGGGWEGLRELRALGLPWGGDRYFEGWGPAGPRTHPTRKFTAPLPALCLSSSGLAAPHSPKAVSRSKRQPHNHPGKWPKAGPQTLLCAVNACFQPPSNPAQSAATGSRRETD